MKSPKDTLTPSDGSTFSRSGSKTSDTRRFLDTRLRDSIIRKRKLCNIVEKRGREHNFV